MNRSFRLYSGVSWEWPNYERIVRNNVENTGMDFRHEEIQPVSFLNFVEEMEIGSLSNF